MNVFDIAKYGGMHVKAFCVPFKLKSPLINSCNKQRCESFQVGIVDSSGSGKSESKKV